MRVRIETTVLYVLSAIGSVWLSSRAIFSYSSLLDSNTWFWVCLLCALSYMLAAVYQIRFSRFSAALALFPSVLQFALAVRYEYLARTFGFSSWLLLNSCEEHVRQTGAQTLTLTACSGVVLIVSLIRLLPQRWRFFRSPANEALWISWCLCFAALCVWYVSSLGPYVDPVIADNFAADIRILHVKKRGLQFHETSFALYRDGRVWCEQTDRRLFAYRIRSYQGGFSVTQDKQQISTDLKLNRGIPSDTPPARPLRSWNAEGWYVLNGDVWAYTTENGRKPPQEVVSLFESLRSRAAAMDVHLENYDQLDPRDICLGFCYDPLAGLGIKYLNQRCRDDRCY